MFLYEQAHFDMEKSEALLQGPHDLTLPSLSELAYHPIDSEDGEIRLAELLPGCYDEPIRISLRTKRIDDPIGYEALSYVWGTAISPKRALVNGCPMRVTVNLDMGLRRLRLCDSPRTLWIDALCINQSDIQERSQQVRHMATIYGRANEVVLWLGELPAILDLLLPADGYTVWVCHVVRDYLAALAKSKQHSTEPPSAQHVFQIMTHICSLPWFGRLWIIQEFALAKSDPIVVLGSQTMSWYSFYKATDTILDMRYGIESQLEAALFSRFDAVTDRICALSQIRQQRQRQGLFSCLFKSRYAMATDPRDKVYGLLGLCKPRASTQITLDYNCSVQQVFAEATVASVIETSSLAYLRYPPHTPQDVASTPGMPSWVMDFGRLASGNSHQQQDYSLGYDEDTFSDIRWDLTARRNNGSRLVRMSEDHQKLHANGRYIGTVCESLFLSTRPKDQEDANGSIISRKQLYLMYLAIMKPKNISAQSLQQALQLSSEMSTSFRFCPNLPRNLLRGRTLLVTEEGHVGVSFHPDLIGIRAKDILVALFGLDVPFILRPVSGTPNYKMINVAYVPGQGDYILEGKSCSDRYHEWWKYPLVDVREYIIV